MGARHRKHPAQNDELVLGKRVGILAFGWSEPEILGRAVTDSTTDGIVHVGRRNQFCIRILNVILDDEFLPGDHFGTQSNVDRDEHKARFFGILGKFERRL